MFAKGQTNFLILDITLEKIMGKLLIIDSYCKEADQGRNFDRKIGQV